MPQTISADERINLFAEVTETLAGSRRPDSQDLAEHLLGLFRNVFRNAFLKFRDGRILMLFLAELNGFEYSHSEELGNGFEYLFQCVGTQGENGQFRTPRHIIDFMVRCLDAAWWSDFGPGVWDPRVFSVGYRHILAKHTSGEGQGSGRHGLDGRHGRDGLKAEGTARSGPGGQTRCVLGRLVGGASPVHRPSSPRRPFGPLQRR